MKVRHFVHDPSDLYAQGLAYLKRDPERKHALRVCCVVAALYGVDRDTLTGMFGVSRGSINGWIKTADEEGFDALKTETSPGRTPRLRPDQIAALREAIAQSPAGRDGQPWNGKTVSAYIRERFSVEYSVRSCQVLLKKMGFRPD